MFRKIHGRLIPNGWFGQFQISNFLLLKFLL